MRSVLSVAVLVIAAAGLAACEGRFVGANVCSKDGSVVWFEKPNAQGSYDGLDNRKEYCPVR
jgi:hypothetical protein